jgi:hypothetical protein
MLLLLMMILFHLRDGGRVVVKKGGCVALCDLLL